MRLAALLLLALPLAAQVEIRFSRQSDEVVRALVGTVPKTVAVYRADVVNVGPNETRFFPSRVGFEAAVTAPMQDPEAALFAAQNFKDTRWWVVTLKGLNLVAKYAGPAALGLSTAGVAVPAIVTGLAGGIGGGAALIDGYHREAARLNVPATWLRDGLSEIILKPGEPVPYLLALGGNPPLGFVAKLQAISQEPKFSPTSHQVVLAIPIATHPMVDEPVIYDTARIAEMIRERSRAIGAVE